MAKNKMDSPLSQSVGADPKKGPEPYETEGHMRTLIDAHEIMNNPDKMKAVHKLAGRHRKAVTSIQGLRDLSNEKALAKGQAAQAPLTDLQGGEPDGSE